MHGQCWPLCFLRLMKPAAERCMQASACTQSTCTYTVCCNTLPSALLHLLFDALQYFTSAPSGNNSSGYLQ